MKTDLMSNPENEPMDDGPALERTIIVSDWRATARANQAASAARAAAVAPDAERTIIRPNWRIAYQAKLDAWRAAAEENNPRVLIEDDLESPIDPAIFTKKPAGKVRSRHHQKSDNNL